MKLRKFKLRSKKTGLLLIAALVVLGIGFKISSLYSTPAYGEVDNAQSEDYYHASTQDNTSPHTYTGKYLSFTYPGRYEQQASPLSGLILESLNLESTDNTSISIALSIQAENITADTGVIYRQQNPSVYSKISSPPGSLYFESNSSGFEEDAFISHGSLVASLVVTANTQAEVGNDFSSIINSIKWNN